MERFGSRVELRVQPGPRLAAQAEHRLDRAGALLAEFDRRLSRFDTTSELSALNADPRDRVEASPMMLRFAEAVGWAGRRSSGLVDAGVLSAVERSGYVESIDLAVLADADALRLVPARPAGTVAGLREVGESTQPARNGARFEGVRETVPAARLAALPAPGPGTWRDVRASSGAVERPAGLRLDSGGIGKGLAADLASEFLRGAPAWVVDCGGDLRIGGTAGVPRAVEVTDPLDPGRILHRLHVTRGAVATSGVTRRSWDQAGVRRHHLIDPRTGLPADTGILQVTALAPTALEAEVLAKTALLAGVHDAHTRLEHGGVIVCANGLVTVVPPPATRRQARPKRVRARFHVTGRPSVLRLLETDR